MNIKKDSVDELNVVLTITIEKKDYEERVDNILKDYRRKARFDGFRPGKVPQGLVNKMYRKPVLVEEIQKVLSESLANYIQSEKINILGEPLPSENKVAQINWDTDTEFEFAFDLGLAPAFDVSVSEKDRLPLYQIRINEEDFTKQVDRICSRYGKLVETDEITGSEMLKADLTELNKQGEPFEGGLHIEGASMALEFVKEEKIKKKFKGCKPGDQLVIEIKKAFENDTDLAALLKVEKERLSSLQRDFRITIRTVSRFEKAEVNQELFDKVYGQDLVHSEEEFKKRIEDEMKAAFERNAQYKFRLDARNYYLAKFKSSLPEAFLKRWLLQSNQGKVTLEQIEKDFDHFIIDLKWQLIKGRIGKDHSLTFTEEDLLTHATVVMRQQFVQYYGVTELPTDLIEKYAKESLGKEEERGRYAESMMEEKVYDFIRQKIKLENKEITSEKFQKLLADN